MTPNETLFFEPLPDREAFEWEIRDVIDDGDIKYIASLLQFGRTSISKMLNPGEIDRHNPFWLVLAIIWALDLKGSHQADTILRIICTRRALWQPKLNIKPEAGRSMELIGTLLMQRVRQDLNGADDDTRLKTAFELRDECDKHIDEIMAMRGLRISVDGVGDVDR